MSGQRSVSSSTLLTCEALMKGWLDKKGPRNVRMTGWRRRWVVLQSDFLFYFTPEQTMKGMSEVTPRGQIDTSDILGILKTRVCGQPGFAIKTAVRRYDFKVSYVLFSLFSLSFYLSLFQFDRA